MYEDNWGDSVEAVGFDMGETLLYYKNVPLSWKGMYKWALSRVSQELQIEGEDEFVRKAQEVLSRYNTRIHRREYEVTDMVIFSDIFKINRLDEKYIPQAIQIFFEYFQQQSTLYQDTIPVLKALKERNIKIGILTDVPYGMNKTLVLRDMEPIQGYLDIILTSVEVGFRKPRQEGFNRLAKELETDVREMMYVGNEEKDIMGANQSGMMSVLIDREKRRPEWNQGRTIQSLKELLLLL
jgi:putative hydrolase of the HAD superfamily